MTPELKIACELVFQEHKSSGQPIKWTRDTFRGRIAIGLSEMAKETLISKNILIIPNKTKRIITQLNPAVAKATSFEEAEEMIKNKEPVFVSGMADDKPAYIAGQVSGFVSRPAEYSHRLLPIDNNAEMPSAEIKWYLKPLFYYIIWPVCAAAAGALIAYLLGLAFTKLFWD
ncbi:MAG: hypothetical protein WDO71_04760 [Bacteroidota bacterium]